MRRCKPQQQLYTPGSGPLRKSAQGVEENELHVNLDAQMNDHSSNSKFNRRKTENSSFKNNNSENVNITNQSDMGLDCRKRNKKPEQAIYVPKPVAQAMADRETYHNSSMNERNVKSMPNPSRNTDRDVDHRIHKRPEHRNGNNISHQNGSMERLNPNSYSKSKRFSTNRKHGNEFSDHYPEENHHLTPVVEQQPQQQQQQQQQQQRQYGGNSRDGRQASEPRAMGPSSHNRVRDTRSVEPIGKNLANHNYQNDNKIQAKPPSGRRHSTICLDTGKSHKNIPNFETLAPRFQRKYLLENNIDPGALEDQWDGTSVTFRGSDNPQYSLPSTYRHPPPNYHPNDNKSYPVPSYMPNTPLPDNHPPQSWSYTIPNTRVRGRGRLQPEMTENTHYGSQVLRSLTPDRIMLLSPCNSRPCTPPPFSQKNRSVENICVNSDRDRCQTPPITNRGFSAGISDNEIKSSTSSMLIHQKPAATRSETSKSSPSNSQSSTTMKNQATKVRDDNILDWSEEVELNEKLEAEALSDSMTRCSSVASLTENGSHHPSSHKSRKSKRSTSRHSRRNKSTDNQNKNIVNHDVDRNHNKQHRRNNKHTTEESGYSQEKLKDNDGFKVPESRNPRRKNSFRDKSNERRRDRRPSYNDNNSRPSSLDRSRRESYSEVENWRDEIRLRSGSEKKEFPNDTKNIETSDRKIETKNQAPGIIVLPQSQVDRTKPPVLHLPDTQPRSMQRSRTISGPQRTLFDPNNPNKPIIVNATNSRALNSTDSTQAHSEIQHGVEANTAVYTTDQFGTKPAWYCSENAQTCHYRQHLLDVRKADMEMQFIIHSGLLLPSWTNGVPMLRKFFRESLEFLLTKDIKFCQTENVENHYWKILYYNIIEVMRKLITSDPDNKEQYKNIILSLIDEGMKYFEKVLELLEDTYKFKLDNFLGVNNMPPWKGLGFIGLALVSAQKIFLFLGDLARYKEQVNETANYGKCRQWYIKAHEINPKNGRPYNQLALLAVYSRRKLEAVYYYMRSLMSSNPVQSAKESLISLFDENRKKYEQTERKRREEKAKLQMKEKESTQTAPGSLRREIWIHPDGGRRLHRTTSAATDNLLDSEEEDLLSLTSVEVNKRFITSYLHVHGKLITKIGMESFQHAALQMLREFRVLLQQSPVPLTSNRFLHLLALNMFAIDSTQLKDPELEPSCRSEMQERALVISLQMFNIILERCVDLLQEHERQQEKKPQQFVQINHDLQVILPAVKVWCDWMLCHSSVWNPPPSCVDYRIGPSSDAWSRLAALMNLLENLDYQKPVLETSLKEGNDMVRLPEDATMCGFTPLMYNSQKPVYVREEEDMEAAQMSVRIGKVLFFGTVFLCGLESPVLKLQRYDNYSEYISVVRTSSHSDSPLTPPELCNEDLLVESFSEDEGEEEQISEVGLDGAPGAEIRSLLDRKVELEKRQRTQELHRQHVQAILQQSVVSVEIEVRPRCLVPDTNCFIDYLDRLQALVRTHGPHTYTLMVPLVVLGELEGLARGGKGPNPVPRVILDPEHMLKVADCARKALEFLHCRNHAVKCLTTHGTVLASSSFTSEDEDRTHDIGPRNDDRILAACLNLCRNASIRDQPASKQQQVVANCDDHQHAIGTTIEPRKIFREVVLLTEDRNLRVKALARDLPVRELPDFLQWAGLG